MDRIKCGMCMPLISLFLSGCTSIIPLKYNFQAAKPGPLAMISPFKVSVVVEDDRPLQQKEGIGYHQWPTHTGIWSSDPSPLLAIRDALGKEFSNNGHIVAAGDQKPDFTVKIVLTKFWLDLNYGDFVMMINADVSLFPKAETAIYKKTVTTVIRRDQANINSRYIAVVNDTLQQFINDISTDAGLIKAIKAR